MRDSIQYPAIRIVYGGVCLLAVAASLRFRAVPSPTALTQLYSFHYYAPIVEKRFILAAPPLPSHIGIGHPILRGTGRRAMERKPIYLSQRRISHLDPRIRHARAALLRSPIKGYYDCAIGSPVVRLPIMMARGSSWLVGGDSGYSEYGGCKGRIRWHTESLKRVQGCNKRWTPGSVKMR